MLNDDNNTSFKAPHDNSLFYQKFSLNQGVANIVKYAWVMKSYEAVQSERDLLIPDGYPEIIFVLNGAYHKQDLKTSKETIIEKSCVVGIQSQSVLASRARNCHLVGLKLYPWAAYRLFKDKLNLIANKNIYIQNLEIPWLSKLNDQLHKSQEEVKIMELIANTLLLQVAQEPDGKSWKSAEAYLKSILEVGGQISVQQLAQQHCLSTRHFQRKFKEYCGISPKKFINIIRFKALYKSSVLQKKLPDNFLEYGYYDQMHFIKDFQKQLSITPSQAKEEAFLRLNDIAKRNT